MLSRNSSAAGIILRPITPPSRKERLFYYYAVLYNGQQKRNKLVFERIKKAPVGYHSPGLAVSICLYRLCHYPHTQHQDRFSVHRM